jgi:hypothetical protein
MDVEGFSLFSLPLGVTYLFDVGRKKAFKSFINSLQR